MVRGGGRLDGRTGRRRACGRPAVRAPVGGRRAALRRRGRDARLGPRARARRDRAEVQGPAHGAHVMQAVINGARLHYERAGAGMPVVFLHAGVADHRMWEPQFEAFAKHFDVIAPDTRGFGRSELPPGGWSPVEADARLWLDGPRRPAGYVKDPIRQLFFAMDSNFDSDFGAAPIERLDPPAAERLHEITAPTLLVVGDEDAPPILDAVDMLMEKVPHARKVVIHDAAHLPNLEHPDEFNRIVLDFLLER